MQQQMIYLKSFTQHIFSQFQKDKCLTVAAELTVTTLLALVPLLTVIFSLLALIPNFQNMAVQLQDLMFEYFVPSTGASMQNYLSEFIGKAKSMSGVGFIMLMVTALLMMRTIDNSFNNIWHISGRKSFVRTFLVYWAILTLGPILLGTSLVVTSYLQSLPMVSDVVEDNSRWLTFGLPMLMEFVTFTLMFFVIPNRQIMIKHAAIAAFVAALLFEIAKFGFAVFVQYFSTYQLIFGALASIPLFLIWIYLSWSIVLFGAEVCHGLFSFVVISRKEENHPFVQLLELILLLAKNQSEGKTIGESMFADHNDWGGRERNIIWLEKLIDAGIVAKLQNHDYCLKVNSDDITYLEIYRVAGKSLPNIDDLMSSSLPESIKNQVECLSKNIKQLFAERLMITR